MAVATAKLVTKVVAIDVVAIDSVTITINEDEFYTTMAILRRVGGCPNKSARKHADSMLEAMINAVDRQIDAAKLDKIAGTVDGNARSIYFKDDLPAEPF